MDRMLDMSRRWEPGRQPLQSVRWRGLDLYEALTSWDPSDRRGGLLKLTSRAFQQGRDPVYLRRRQYFAAIRPGPASWTEHVVTFSSVTIPMPNPGCFTTSGFRPRAALPRCCRRSGRSLTRASTLGGDNRTRLAGQLVLPFASRATADFEDLQKGSATRTTTALLAFKK